MAISATPPRTVPRREVERDRRATGAKTRAREQDSREPAGYAARPATCPKIAQIKAKMESVPWRKEEKTIQRPV